MCVMRACISHAFSSSPVVPNADNQSVTPFREITSLPFGNLCVFVMLRFGSLKCDINHPALCSPHRVVL